MKTLSTLLTTLALLFSPVSLATSKSDQDLQINFRNIDKDERTDDQVSGFGVAYNYKLIPTMQISFSYIRDNWNNDFSNTAAFGENNSTLENYSLGVDYELLRFKNTGWHVLASAGVNFHNYKYTSNVDYTNGEPVYKSPFFEDNDSDLEYKLGIANDYHQFQYGAYAGSSIYGKYIGGHLSYDFGRWKVKSELRSFTSDIPNPQTVKDSIFNATHSSQISLIYSF